MYNDKSVSKIKILFEKLRERFWFAIDEFTSNLVQDYGVLDFKTISIVIQKLYNDIFRKKNYINL